MGMKIIILRNFHCYFYNYNYLILKLRCKYFQYFSEQLLKILLEFKITIFDKLKKITKIHGWWFSKAIKTCYFRSYQLNCFYYLLWGFNNAYSKLYCENLLVLMSWNASVYFIINGLWLESGTETKTSCSNRFWREN